MIENILRNLKAEERKELARELEELRIDLFWIESSTESAKRRVRIIGGLFKRAHRRELRRTNRGVSLN